MMQEAEVVSYTAVHQQGAFKTLLFHFRIK